MDTTQDSRSPSPEIKPPIASTPGPRATALQKLYSDAIAHVLKTCNYSNFSACFPTPAREVPQALKMLHGEFTGKLDQSMRSEFDDLMEERHVVPSLNELDGLIEEARRRKGKAREGQGAGVQPHELPPAQLHLAHLAPALSEYSQQINTRQETLQSENVEMLDRVMKQRREINALLQGLETVMSDLESSVGSLQTQESSAAS